MCKKHRIESFLLYLFLFLVSSTGALGANRDVCPSGCAYSSIYEAFSNALTGDVIRVAAGTYYQTDQIRIDDSISITIQGGWNSSFTSRSSDPSLTIVDMLNKDRFLYIYARDGDSMDVVVEGLSITEGSVTGSGGAIYAYANVGSGAVADAVIRLTVQGTLVSGCRARNDGGAISAYATDDSEAFRSIIDLTVVDNRFTGNFAMNRGGAFYLRGNGYSDSSHPVLRYTIKRNRIHGNTGGSSTLYIDHYRSDYHYLDNGSSISTNDISGNSAFQETSVLVYMERASSLSPLHIRNNLVCNNWTWSSGYGAIGLESYRSSPTVDLVNNTVSGNGGYGLVGRSYGDSGFPDNFVLNLYNNIFHQNQPVTNLEEVYLSDSSEGNMVANAGSNIFTGSPSEGINASSVTYNDLGDNITGDALLGDDFHLTVSSPAINNANAAQAPVTDMNGAARVGPPDIGAIEYSGSDHRAAAAVPTGPVEVSHARVAVPTVSSEPLVARPFACGNVDSGTVTLRTALPAFSAPVDVYAGISVPWGPDVYMITPAGGLALLSEGLVKWKTAQTAAVDQSFFGNLDASILPKGRYGLHLLVVPAGNLSMAFHYYESEMIIR